VPHDMWTSHLWPAMNSQFTTLAVVSGAIRC
jgi:hypothetical protein